MELAERPKGESKPKRSLSHAERERAKELSAQQISETIAKLDAMEVYGAYIREEYEALIERFGPTDEHGSLIWTEAMQLHVAMIGLVTMVFLARRGDREAAKWLAEKGLGAPEQPFSHRISNLTEREAEDWMLNILRSRNMTGSTATNFLAMLTTSDLSGIEARLAALPTNAPEFTGSPVDQAVNALKALDGDDLLKVMEVLDLPERERP